MHERGCQEKGSGRLVELFRKSRGELIGIVLGRTEVEVCLWEYVFAVPVFFSWNASLALCFLAVFISVLL